MGQTLYIAYQMRPVKIRKELQPLYQNMFEPLHFPSYYLRGSSQLNSLNSCIYTKEAYAMELSSNNRLDRYS
ncbi:Blood vessel epicardial substance [Armadillidium vulgare]|nr:Blood vessel epicardial substance [Armadillidium vulgare]